ncbi:hypothetical protein GOODEAATRI_023952 [Goodea atripinnis]|uniref:Aminotransferase class V domain-containing protein n=1 Tax=Goodea atripinnis TaxID=208336 RepID=A0ABV0NX59_9TELE
MQRSLFGRSASLAQLAAAALDGPLASRSAPALQRLERSMSSVNIPPPECMLRPLEVPVRYLFGPGPSNVPPRVLAAASRPIIGHMHPEMYEIMNDIKKGIQYAFQTDNNMTIAMSASGHAAMECAVFNVVEPGESVLITVNGIWGERVAEIAERIGRDLYHHTGPVSGFFALRESLAILAEKDLRLPSVTTISIPEGYEWREMLTYIMKNHQMEMTGGLGPSLGMVSFISLVSTKESLTTSLVSVR